MKNLNKNLGSQWTYKNLKKILAKILQWTYENLNELSPRSKWNTTHLCTAKSGCNHTKPRPNDGHRPVTMPQ